jgi:hypothetical protein
MSEQAKPTGLRRVLRELGDEAGLADRLAATSISDAELCRLLENRAYRFMDMGMYGTAMLLRRAVHRIERAEGRA